MHNYTGIYGTQQSLAKYETTLSDFYLQDSYVLENHVWKF